MTNYLTHYWTLLWPRASAHDVKVKIVVKRLGVLQQTASNRRAEYAQDQERASLSEDASLPGLLASSRKRMEDAESAHTAALQV